MPQIEIYTTRTCPYCIAAKKLLDARGASWKEIAVDGDPQLRQLMMERSHGRHSVPQIFIDGKHIGGFDDLHAADQRGELAMLLTK